MSEDKAPDSPLQGASTPQNLTEALFGPYIDQCWVTAGKARDKTTWKGHFYRRDKVTAFDPEHGHYFSIALPKKGATSRDLVNFEAGRLIVVDDVGITISADTLKIAPGAKVDINDFRLFAPETNYEVETSYGNFQMGFVIDPPERDFARWSHFINEAKKNVMFGRGFEDCTPVHYVRMETGRNQPKPLRPRFNSRLAKAYDGGSYTLDELADAFGIDMSVAAVQASKPTKSSGETCSVETLKKMLGLLPNDRMFDARVAPDGKPCWVSMAAAIRNITNGSDEGLALWLEWNEQRPQDPGAPEALWESVYEPKASAATLRKWIEAKYGGKYSREYQLVAADINQDQAPAAFGDLPDDVLEAAVAEETRKAENRFRELLEEIRKTRKVPAHHKANGGNYDQNWLPLSGGLLDIGQLSKTMPVAPPVIFEPFVRGGLTVIGGAPSVGKSNLTLDQALAVAAGRGDLLRRGLKLQFPGDVIYISNEDDISVLQRRAMAWATYHKVDLTKLPHKLIVVRTELFRKDAKDEWHAACIAVLERVLEHCLGGADIAMIAVDTLGTSVSGIDEHQIKDMSPVMKLLRDLAQALWCSVAFLHHTTKEAWARGSADATLRSIATIRGSGGITGTYTRGATLIVAPNKSELEAHPDWAGKDIVVEFMAKANDGPEGFVAAYYLRVLVAVEQVSAEDGTKTEFRNEPVLVPFTVTAFNEDLAVLDGYLEVLRGYPGTIWVVDKIGSNGSPNSIQKILGVTNQVAKRILDALVLAKKVTVEPLPDSKGRVHDTLIIDENTL